MSPSVNSGTNFHVMTLFPDMILQGLNTSIMGRAIASGIISLEAVNIIPLTSIKRWTTIHTGAVRGC